jgi:hypothetical protein
VLQGVAVVRPGTTLRIARGGVRQGVTRVEPGGHLCVDGLLQGAVFIHRGGDAEIDGTVEGAIDNNGRLVLRGVHRGARRGGGEVVETAGC